MKKYLTFFLLIIQALVMQGQTRVNLKITSGLEDSTVKSRIENGSSTLLTEIKQAANGHHDLKLTTSNMTAPARESLNRLWNTYHFRPNSSVYSTNCITTVSGYEVRGIGATVCDVDDSFVGDKNKELFITFSKTGVITGIHMTLGNNMYTNVVGSGVDVTDIRRREEILRFVEEFRSYYDEKDINALRDIYSDDALIITGTVKMRKNLGDGQARLKPEIVYSRKKKEQYLASLEKTFRNNRYIKVNFDDIKVVRHPAKKGFYGVTLHQSWRSSNYDDDGYVFLLWEFKDDNDTHPVIHVRTWQPDMVGNEALPESAVFTHNDFFIP